MLAEKLGERGHVDDVVVAAFEQAVEPIRDILPREAEQFVQLPVRIDERFTDLLGSTRREW